MNVREAVCDMQNYGDIVMYFEKLKTFSMDDMVLLVDVIDHMSEEIFEHYKALCDMCKAELQRIRASYYQQNNFDFLTDTQQHQLAYVIGKAIKMGILLTEKYQDIAVALNDN